MEVNKDQRKLDANPSYNIIRITYKRLNVFQVLRILVSVTKIISTVLVTFTLDHEHLYRKLLSFCSNIIYIVEGVFPTTKFRKMLQILGNLMMNRTL